MAGMLANNAGLPRLQLIVIFLEADESTKQPDERAFSCTR